MSSTLQQQKQDHNAPLDHLMMRKGFSLTTSKQGQYCHFTDNSGKYIPFPVGYITGPQVHEPGGYYISVMGNNGWLQSSFKDRESAMDWALKTAKKVLSDKKQLEPQEIFTVWPDGSFEGNVPSELYGTTVAVGNLRGNNLANLPCADGCHYALGKLHVQHLTEAWSTARETNTEQRVNFSSLSPILLEMGHLRVDTEQNALLLPQHIILEHYPAIKQKLLNAGGIYLKNKFQFSTDVNVLFQSLLNGENPN